MNYLILLGWGFVGGLAYWLIKLSVAYNRPDFEFDIFIKKNLMNLIAGLFSILLLIAILVKGGFDFILDDRFDDYWFVAIGLGANGTMILKALLNGSGAIFKRIMNKFFKKDDTQKRSS